MAAEAPLVDAGGKGDLGHEIGWLEMSVNEDASPWSSVRELVAVPDLDEVDAWIRLLDPSVGEVLDAQRHFVLVPRAERSTHRKVIAEVEVGRKSSSLALVVDGLKSL